MSIGRPIGNEIGLAIGKAIPYSGAQQVLWDLASANPAANYELTNNGKTVSPASNLASRYAIKADVVITGTKYWETLGNGVGSAYDNAYYGVCPSSKDFTADTDIIGDFDGGRRQGDLYTRSGDTNNVGTPVTGWSFNQIIRHALDVPNGKYWMGYYSGGLPVWIGGGDPVAGTSPTWTLDGSVAAWSPCASVQKAVAALRIFSTASELTYPLEGFEV